MSEKNLDCHGRWRKKTIAFRVTPEEYEKIGSMAKIAGMTKQDYILNCLENREVVVVGNPRVYKALKNHMEQLYQEIKSLANVTELDPEKVEILDFLGRIYEGMGRESSEPQT